MSPLALMADTIVVAAWRSSPGEPSKPDAGLFCIQKNLTLSSRNRLDNVKLRAVTGYDAP